MGKKDQFATICLSIKLLDCQLWFLVALFRSSLYDVQLLICASLGHKIAAIKSVLIELDTNQMLLFFVEIKLNK